MFHKVLENNETFIKYVTLVLLQNIACLILLTTVSQKHSMSMVNLVKLAANLNVIFSWINDKRKLKIIVFNLKVLIQ